MTPPSVPEPVGTDRDHQFFRWVWLMITGWLRPVAGKGIFIDWGPRGFVIHTKPQATTVSTPSLPANAVAYTLVSIRGDYWIGQPFNANPSNPNDPTKNVAIAKLPENRLSVTQALIDGIVFTYAAGPGFDRRTATNGTSGQVIKQQIVPRYQVKVAAAPPLPAQSASVIFAVPVDTTNTYGTGVVTDVAVGTGKVGDAVKWIEHSPRAWCDKYDQTN